MDVEQGVGSSGGDGGGGGGGAKITVRLDHPIALLFHMFFRLLAIVCYVLLALFVDSFVIVFVTVVLLLAIDFWTVKNVTGRLLVGLRWWNEVKENGDTEWKYESLQVRSSTSLHCT